MRVSEIAVTWEEVSHALKCTGRKATGTDGLDSQTLKDADLRQLIVSKAVRAFKSWADSGSYPNT